MDARYFIHQNMSTPCLDVIDSASGSRITNINHQSYLDFHGNSVHQVGFQNEYVIQKVKEQLEKLSFCTRRYTNIQAIKLAERLLQESNGEFSKVLFAPGGTIAIGMALKMARYITGRHKLISFWDSFHGASLDTISAGGEAVFRKHMGPTMPGVERIPPPNTYRGILGEDENKYIDYFEYVVEKEGDIGAFLAEPIRNTDVMIPSKKFWKRIREICDKHGIFLIFDEIPTGLGRTGNMFVWQHYDVIPDIVCVGKGLGGGLLPLAAMLTHEKYDKVSDVSVGHYTHEKNPLCATAGLSTLEYISANSLVEKAKTDAVYIEDKFRSLKEKHSTIGDIRGIGLLWAIELVQDRVTKEKAIDMTEAVMYGCLKKGLSCKVSQGNIILFTPPLTVEREELEQAFTILDEVIKELS
jgi:4-aminobutyrate aminotransferase